MLLLLQPQEETSICVQLDFLSTLLILLVALLLLLSACQVEILHFSISQKAYLQLMT